LDQRVLPYSLLVYENHYQGQSTVYPVIGKKKCNLNTYCWPEFV
jgi:hypothetical protein